jgi:hypothetical protein
LFVAMLLVFIAENSDAQMVTEMWIACFFHTYIYIFKYFLYQQVLTPEFVYLPILLSTFNSFFRANLLFLQFIILQRYYFLG